MNKIYFLISLFSLSFLSAQSLKGVDTIVLNYDEFDSIEELSNRISLDLDNINDNNLTLYINDKAICSYWVE